MNSLKRPRIVIIGAGFGGLNAAKALKDEDADVLIIDRNNFHTFTPLLYQVATSGLEPGEIVYPVRGIFRKQHNLQFLLGEVTRIDPRAQVIEVRVNGQIVTEHYDYLIIATGSVTNFFGNETIAEHAFELKTLEDAIKLRNHILRRFEQAAWTEDRALQQALTTFVVVGGGPTGLETAGALHELIAKVLKQDYPFLRELTPRVILIEATDRLLAPYPASLQRSARRQLESLGVEVITGKRIVEASEQQVVLHDGSIIPTHTLIWSAGVKASPIAEHLGVPLKQGGRVPVEESLAVKGLENVYVIGDLAYLEDENGQPYPMVIPVAKQQGTLAGRNIARRIRGWSEHPFRYHDRGIMATIGRSRAVAYLFNRIPLTGYIAWVAWLGLHLITLMGFRNRLNVLVNWVWNYFTYDRSVRLIIEQEIAPPIERENRSSENETGPRPLLNKALWR